LYAFTEEQLLNKYKWRKILKDLFNRFINDDLLSTGAQVTFFLLLSLFPFLIFLITLISYTPIANFKDNLEDLSSFLPANAYQVIIDTIRETVLSRSGTLLSFGMIITLWSSSSGILSLIRGINKAYDQEETRPFWKVIGVSLFFTAEIAAVIILSLILIVFGKLLGTFCFNILGFSNYFLKGWNDVRHTITLIVAIIVFVSLYRNTPNHRLTLKEVLPGSVFATLAWVIISVAFSYYANNFNNYSWLYGGLGGIIALLTWLYLSSIIILLGAEINASILFYRMGRVKTKCRRF
jgi:membrane protein